MNKRFSTLLATALVAGGLSSTAMAQKVLDTTKYYHVALSGDANSRVIIGHSEDGKRDSVAVVEADDIKLYEDFNATLWKPTVEQKVNAAGGVYYEIKLVNKEGQALTISKENVKASQTSFFKAQYAYIDSEGIGAMTVSDDVVSIDEDGVITFNKGPEARTNIYDAEASKMYQYALVVKDGAVKVMMAEGTPAEAPAVTPKSGDCDIMGLWLKDVETNLYTLTSSDLSKEANDSFELTFSNDVKNSEIGNLFSEHKLRAVPFEKMYSTAVYSTDYAEASAKAKESLAKAFADIKPAYAAYKAEQKTAIDRAKAGKATSTNLLLNLAENKRDLDDALTEFSQTSLLYLRSLDMSNPDNQKKPALWNKLDSIRMSFATIQLTEGEALKADNKELKEYEAVVKRADKMLNDLEAEAKMAFHVVDSVMNAFMSNPYQIDGSAKATFKTGREEDNLGKFADSGRETLQRNFLTQDIINSGTNIPTDAVAIATDLIAVGTAAEADCVTTESKDIVASGADAEGYYAIAIVDSLIDGKQAYLSVDTNYVAEKEQYFMFKADTLTSTGTDNEVVAAFGKCINLFAYQLTVNPELIAGDEVTINTFMPTATTQGQWYSEGITPTKAVVVIRSLANNSHREVSVAANTSDPSYENTTITFKSLEGPKPTFEVGDVFFIKSLKKEDARKPYQVMTSTTGDDIVGATAVYNNVPATQWIVTEANKQDGKYQLANRDADKNFFASATKIIVKDAENNIYITAGKDTLEMTAVADQKDAYLGYKHINDADKEHLTFKLTATNFVNPEAKYYLTMAADSSVIATADADKALELKAKNAGWLFKLNDTDLSAASYGFELYLGEDTLYFRNDAASFDGNDLMLTKVATKDSVKLRRVNDNASQYELLWNVSKSNNLESEKIAIDQNGKVVVVAEDEITNWAFNLESAVTESYLNIADAPKNVTISLKGDEASKVTAVRPFAVIKRTGLELKAAATDNDFVLGLDTAYVNRPDNYRYAYYITKAIDTAKVGTFDTKAYMVSYADSTAHNSDTVKYDQDGLTRIGFVNANRVEFGNNDSLAIAKPAAKTADTLNIADKKGITNATWAFPIDDDNEGYYRIEVAPAANKADKKYVSYLNGVLVLGNKEQAQLFAINDTDLKPTDNEEITTSEVKVIAGEGQVTIAGATGKKVVVTNVLGQVVANKVITSDNSVIAAPQGVVVVAVEGEEAVKAVVE